VVHFLFFGAKDERNMHHKKIEHFFSSLEATRFLGIFCIGAFSLEDTIKQNVISLYFLQQTSESGILYLYRPLISKKEPEITKKRGVQYGERGFTEQKTGLNI
jgi:hypothetical protein